MRADSGLSPLTDTKTNGMVHNPRDREVSIIESSQRKIAILTINFLTTSVEYETDSPGLRILKGFYGLVGQIYDLSSSLMHS